MILELNKDDLISLVKGQEPSYSAMDHPKIKNLGRFAASYGRWDWGHDSFKNMTEGEIYEVYFILKNS